MQKNLSRVSLGKSKGDTRSFDSSSSRTFLKQLMIQITIAGFQ